MTNKPVLTFADLKALEQTSRSVCGKRAYTHSQARDTARIRNTLANGAKTFYIHLCHQGCGKGVFHLTTRAPEDRKSKALNKGLNRHRTRYVFGKRTRKNSRNVKNRQMYQILSVGTWEDDGGALHPRDLEG